MKRSILYTAVFSAMMMVTGCGGGESNSTNDITTQISEKRDLTYTTDEDGNYYLDFSEMKSNTKALIQKNGKFYTYDDHRNERFLGDHEGVKTYYNEKNRLNFEYFENGDMKVDVFDRENRFVKRIFGVVKDGVLYTQETTDSNKMSIDESKPLILQNEITNKISQFMDMVKPPVESNQSSILAKNINFSFFPTAYANEYTTQKNYKDKSGNVMWGLAFVAAAVDLAAGVAISSSTIATLPVIIPTIITIFGAKIIYENSPLVRDFFDAPINTTKKGLSNFKEGLNNLISNILNTLISNENTSEEEIEYWRKLLEEEKKKCLANGMELINDVCKKEEEPQCFADEILVDGICKKKEPVCLADEILENGKCIKRSIPMDSFLINTIVNSYVEKETLYSSTISLGSGECSSYQDGEQELYNLPVKWNFNPRNRTVSISSQAYGQYLTGTYDPKNGVFEIKDLDQDTDIDGNDRIDSKTEIYIAGVVDSNHKITFGQNYIVFNNSYSGSVSGKESCKRWVNWVLSY